MPKTTPASSSAEETAAHTSGYITGTGTAKGYWLAGSDGSVLAFGDAAAGGDATDRVVGQSVIAAAAIG